jgi:hypothetical protein
MAEAFEIKLATWPCGGPMVRIFIDAAGAVVAAAEEVDAVADAMTVDWRVVE